VSITRRTLLTAAAVSAAGSVASGKSDAAAATVARSQGASASLKPYRHRRIATEEAFTTPALAEAYKILGRTTTSSNLDIAFMKSIFDDPTPGSIRDEFRRRLLDLDTERLAIMDESGVDMHLLSLTIPGVQMFDADTALDFSVSANDALAEAVRRHPTRFGGLACFAPQSPRRAAKEMERATQNLKLNGFIVNSHTNNEYLDETKFWPIFEAAEALGRPIYLHPRSPSDGMAAPFRNYQMSGSIWGYAAETGTHAVRLIFSGVFDRFPKLKIVLGHMGEAVPYWLWRLDFMHARRTAEGMTKKLQLTPSEYFRRNFAITTSGVESHDVLTYVVNVLGVDNVMWAIDYPYQPTQPAVAFMDTAPLPPSVLAKVYHQNAERIFHLV
jgi:5-carboxyvanillate decarboxylase